MLKNIWIIVILFFASLVAKAEAQKIIKLNWENISQEQYVDNLLECQSAIKELQWSHSLWPKENKKPKPEFSKVYNEKQAYEFINNHLKYESLLNTEFKQEITSQMLQNEINRMVSNTKKPKRLIELFQLFDNNPTSISECIARPYLVSKSLHKYYYNDNSIHLQLKAQAQGELNNYLLTGDLQDLSAKTNTIKFHLEDKIISQSYNKSHKNSGSIELSSKEFNNKINQLKGFSNTIQQHENYFIFSEILTRSETEFEVKSLIWSKVILSNWLNDKKDFNTITHDSTELYLSEIGNKTENFVTKNIPIAADTWLNKDVPKGGNFPTVLWTGTEMLVWGGANGDLSEYYNNGSKYNPITDSWISMQSVGAPSKRFFFGSVWTGSEMIVWGGYDGADLKTGARYNPLTDTWQTIEPTGTPIARRGLTAIWTGDKMVVWGGFSTIVGGALNSGGVYDLATNTWNPITLTDAPIARVYHTAVWTGSEMIIWGGFDNVSTRMNSGGKYDLDLDNWTATNTATAPSPRRYHTTVWAGSEMIIWGGQNGISTLNDGSRYNPGLDSWIPLSNLGSVPSSRTQHTAIITPSEMIIWGGLNGTTTYATGGRYDLTNNTWSATSNTDAPTQRRVHKAIWTGSEMIVWGGQNNLNIAQNSGSRYNPSTDSWQSTKIPQTQVNRAFHTSIWTGNEMIIWGGFNGSSYLNSGSRYNPTTDTWVVTPLSIAPTGRFHHTASWTGTKMVIWGGVVGNLVTTGTGANYIPLSDTWETISMASAPNSRYVHTAVWTGDDVLIWGGYNYTNNFTTGGKYDPDANTWSSIATSGQPSTRRSHTAVWTGEDMIIWGGFGDTNTGFGDTFLGNGGKYNLTTNTWSPVALLNAPLAKSEHRETWTGSKMILWGGNTGGTHQNTGSLYDPVTDEWTNMTTSGAPSARSFHTQIWTGTEMIIWGGSDVTNEFNNGSRYDPVADTWSSITLANAPSKRYYHKAIWTGEEMIVTGGRLINGTYLNNTNFYYPTGLFSIGGSIVGLVPGSTIVLQNNLGDDLSLMNNGSFTFATSLTDSNGFNVSIKTQPTSPAQNCLVTGGSGNLTGSNYTGVTITCNAVTISDTEFILSNWSETVLITIAGASSSVLHNPSGGNPGSYRRITHPLPGNSRIEVFHEFLGANYTPSTQGAINSVDYTEDQIEFSPPFAGAAIGASPAFIQDGTVFLGPEIVYTNLNWQSVNLTGLTATDFMTGGMLPDFSASGSTIHFGFLRSNSNTGAATFSTQHGIDNWSYTIQPTESAQYTVGGLLTGLASGSSIVLQNNSGNDMTLTANGMFVFPNSILGGTDYAVTVLTSPTNPSQACTVTNGNGVNIASNVTSIGIACSIDKFTVGGTISGLSSGSSVVLQNNLGDDLILTNNNPFTFATSLNDLSGFSVSVLTQPTIPTQTCSVTGGGGDLAGSNYTNVVIDCNTAPIAVSDSFNTLEETTLIVLIADSVLNNDSDVDLDNLSVVEPASTAAGGVGGTVVFSSNGTFVYTPPSDANGQATFAYQITDGVHNVDANLTIDVSSVNDAPSFDIIGDLNVSSLINSINNEVVINDFASNLVFGPVDEQMTQSLSSFNVSIVSDSNSILTNTPVMVGNDLMINLTFNSGVAIIHVSLTDNGGNANGGNDTSVEIEFTIGYTDLVYLDGFENPDVLKVFSKLGSTLLTHTQSSQISYDYETDSLEYYNHNYHLNYDYSSPQKMELIEYWIDEIYGYKRVSKFIH